MAQGIPDALELILNIIFIISGLALAVIPLMWDIRKDAPIIASQAVHFRPNRKVFTTAGKIFIVIVAISAATGAIKFVLDSHSQKDLLRGNSALLVGNEKLIAAHKQDSLAQIIKDERCRKDAEIISANYQLSLLRARDSINSSVKQMGQNINDKADRNTEKILNDSAKAKNPLLDLSLTAMNGDILPNPELSWNYVTNTGTLTVSISNFGTSNAFNFKYRFIQVYLENNEYNLSLVLGRFTKNVIIYREVPWDISLKLSDGESHNVNDLKYIAMEVTYENEFHKKQRPLHKIFIIDKNYAGKGLPVITDDKYTEIDNLLLQSQWWQYIP